jgi:hypothetical protein
MRKRRIQRGGATNLKTKSLKDMLCSICGEIEEVDNDTVSVICAMCVQRRCPVDPKFLAPKQKVDPNSVKPRGWKFMKEFVDTDGTVYHIGVVVPELKGTLPPTDIASIKAAQKEKSKMKKVKKAEKKQNREAKLVKEFEKKKKQKEKMEKNQLQKEKEEKFFEE